MILWLFQCKQKAPWASLTAVFLVWLLIFEYLQSEFETGCLSFKTVVFGTGLL